MKTMTALALLLGLTLDRPALASAVHCTTYEEKTLKRLHTRGRS